MITCFFWQQAEVLFNLKSFEVDMAFKRCKTKNLNEIVFATYLSILEKGKRYTFLMHYKYIANHLVFTLTHVYVTEETTAMYKTMFQKVFSLMFTWLQQELHWKHIHDDGMTAVTMNMNLKQCSDKSMYSELILDTFLIYLDLSQYLQFIDPHQHFWQWHSKYTVIYCIIHFKREIDKAAETNHNSDSIHTCMLKLLHCQSQSNYYELLQLIIDRDTFLIHLKSITDAFHVFSDSFFSNNSIHNWAHHKSHAYIVSEINKHCSLMNHDTFDSIQNHTNAVKTTHFKSNALKRQLPLLSAIL